MGNRITSSAMSKLSAKASARSLVLLNKDAALIVRDGDAKLQLVSTSIQLAKDKQMQELFIKNCHLLALKDADIVIANEILKAIQ